MLRRFAFAFVALIGIGCRGPAPAPAEPIQQRVPFVVARAGATMRVQWSVPQREGQLSDSQLVALSPRIAGLRAVPDSFALDAAGTLALAPQLAVFAVDDSGRVLGELRRYGFSVRAPLQLDSTGTIRATGPGRGFFQAFLPARYVTDGRTRSPAVVQVTITDTSGVFDQSTVLPTGNAVVQGIVRDDAGSPLAGANVQVLLLVASGPTPVGNTQTDGDGRYRVGELPPGEVILLITSRGREPSVSRHTLALDAELSHNARLAAQPRLPESDR